MADDSNNAELASIREQLKHLTSTMDEIKEGLASFQKIHTQLAEHTIRYEGLKSEQVTMWTKLDTLRNWTESHNNYSSNTRREIDASISTVKSEVDGAVNKTRGAFFILGIVGVVGWALVSGVTVWLVNNVNDQNGNMKVIQYRMQQLEAKK